VKDKNGNDSVCNLYMSEWPEAHRDTCCTSVKHDLNLQIKDFHLKDNLDKCHI